MPDVPEDILFALAKGKAATGKGQNFLTIGVDHLPALPLDNTDRKRFADQLDRLLTRLKNSPTPA